MSACERRYRHGPHLVVGAADEYCPGLPVDLPAPRRARDTAGLPTLAELRGRRTQ